MELALFIVSASLMTLGILITYLVEDKKYISIILLVFGSAGLVWIVIRKLVIWFLFPGSFWIFRKSLELFYSKEISSKAYSRLDKLKNSLMSLKATTSSETPRITQKITVLISSLILNFEELENKNKKQKKLLSLLSNLKDSLENIKVKYDSIELSYWHYIEHHDEDSPFFSPSENNPNDRINNSIMTIQEIQDLISPEFEEKNCFFAIKSYLSSLIFGSLDYMRSDLMNRFTADHYFIDNRIDSVFLSSEIDSKSAVIFCNPNAGFYEFFYFQSDWLEFYLSHHINVILWNYRGYGRSSGCPNILKNIEDGEAVLGFYAQNKSISKFCVHGESIGGAVAVQLAHHPMCEFLLADRTFGKLSDVVKYRYGRGPYYLYRVSLLPDIDITLSYISLSCFKVVSCDPSDSVIPDFVSLKSSVSFKIMLRTSLTIGRYFSSGKWAKTDYVLSPDEYLSFANCLNNLLKSSLTDLRNDEKKISSDTDFHHEDKTSSCKFIKILQDLDSCGSPLLTTASQDPVQFFLQTWLMSFEIWGSFNTSFIDSDFSNKTRAVNQIKEAISDLNQHESLGQTKTLQNILSKIYKHLTEKANLNSDYSKAGSFMLVNCGHAGVYSSLNKHQLEILLIHSSFI